MSKNIALTGTERFFEESEIIVSKTDLKGRVTYCNKTFVDICGYSEKEMLGQPHSIIRHPDMPRCVFELMWETLQNDEEIFAYVVNRCKNGDHYWVNAHITPSKDQSGTVVGYHSNRRVPDRTIVNTVIIPLYKQLMAEENAHANRKDGQKASRAMLDGILKSKDITYHQFIATL
ncbi:PAS domain-containing protein [uncultured Cohaesibacter sp.]|uniref:PAS domain-containing protein n=1 Tax=uncultured Cohaesibacter sp. TaxID=1002546 RepID=UPI0029C80AB2|nr:PAS domain-containing protein [uncultured Cohaesibacter sp.]